ncbi:nucleotidyltransferase domain-containing protein [Burkholderia stagnalis]|uniref:anti-phage Hailong system nucleotidyltransferase HalB n=1 Tax=Burkholderia stagnalis TaxID=1503054 RepID=UPI000AAC3FDC|nr:nucleotidyltransferase domain-containing protein [Burkholderia stagnalis]
MSILALALYGSRAREDHSPDSDVDLFAITDECSYKMIVESNVNIACYPRDLAATRAQGGDLFILHITQEGKTLFDNAGELKDLHAKFSYRNSYEIDIRLASDLAWFVLDMNSLFKNYTLINKRIAWCVRTILIAMSAEARRPVFSSSQLRDFSGSEEAYLLIENKDSNQQNTASIGYLTNFLAKFGRKRPILSRTPTLQEYRTYFVDSKNTMGIKTVAAIDGISFSHGYI